ncbi:MAG: hypothetical protein P3A58_06350 [Gemmatimonadota bacterium]|nr:hypothetical protein [Gemmatimonadota bacterium]
MSRRGKRSESAEAARDRRNRWWGRNTVNVVTVVLAVVSFGVILLLLQLVGGR